MTDQTTATLTDAHQQALRTIAAMMIPASARRSRSCSGSRSWFGMGSSSVEQVGEALLDAVGNVERQRLDGRGRVHAAGGHPDTAIDDE